MDVIAPGRVELDPSRVAAQIVTGIGFIGAGLIFVESSRVRGLTTAATVWLVTAVGMACGAGLLLLALVVTIAYFVVALVFPLLTRRISSNRHARPRKSTDAEDFSDPTSPPLS
jgi:putative Mg2+ transporter-C (MgtC) family protein